MIRRLCVCLAIDICETSNLSPELVVAKAGEIVNELQRLRNKLTEKAASLHECEAELLAARTTACNDKQSSQQQFESIQSHAQTIESRCRQAERDLQLVRDRLGECETGGDKLREELRGFESRCCRLQNTIDRMENDRIQYLRNLASIVALPEPCESLIKDKVRDMVNVNQSMENVCFKLISIRVSVKIFDFYCHFWIFLQQLHSLRDRISAETNSLRNERNQKSSVEERLEKALHDLHQMKGEHTTVSTTRNWHGPQETFFNTKTKIIPISETIDCSFRSIWCVCREH